MLFARPFTELASLCVCASGNKALPSSDRFRSSSSAADGFVCTSKDAIVADGGGGQTTMARKKLPLSPPPLSRAGVAALAADRQAHPSLTPDVSVSLDTQPDQALLYRLNGDFNPLHSDPDVPKSAGFSRPSLRGLSTFAITCRAAGVLQLRSDEDREPRGALLPYCARCNHCRSLATCQSDLVRGAPNRSVCDSDQEWRRPCGAAFYKYFSAR